MPKSCTEVRCSVRLTSYYRRFGEGFAEIAAPLTALGSPTTARPQRVPWAASQRGSRGPQVRMSFEALKLALSSEQMLQEVQVCTFDPSWWAVLT